MGSALEQILLQQLNAPIYDAEILTSDFEAMRYAHPSQNSLEWLIDELLALIGVQLCGRAVCICDNLKGIRYCLCLDVFGGGSPRLARELVNDDEDVFLP